MSNPVVNLTVVNEKLDRILAILEPGETPQETIETPVPDFDPLAAVVYLESLEGKHEAHDKEDLMNRFEKYNILDHRGQVYDPVRDYWCGAALRLAVVAAGWKDPGIEFNKASNWELWGVEAKDPDAPGVVRVYHTHVSMNSTDGINEIGGNVKDRVFKSPIVQAWFGKPVAYRTVA